MRREVARISAFILQRQAVGKAGASLGEYFKRTFLWEVRAD